MKKAFFALIAVSALFTAFCALSASAPLAVAVALAVMTFALYMTNK